MGDSYGKDFRMWAALLLSSILSVGILLLVLKHSMFPPEEPLTVELRGVAGSIVETQIPLHYTPNYAHGEIKKLVVETPPIGSPRITETMLSAHIITAGTTPTVFLVLRGQIPNIPTKMLRNRLMIQYENAVHYVTINRSRLSDVSAAAVVAPSHTTNFNQEGVGKVSTAAIVVGMAIPLVVSSAIVFIVGAYLLIGVAIISQRGKVASIEAKRLSP